MAVTLARSSTSCFYEYRLDTKVTSETTLTCGLYAFWSNSLDSVDAERTAPSPKSTLSPLTAEVEKVTTRAIIQPCTSRTTSINILPVEIKLLVFDELFFAGDACTSTCLGLTCKAFYSIHRAFFPSPVDLLTSIPRYQPSANLCDLLEHWVPKDMELRILFEKNKVMFMTQLQWDTKHELGDGSELEFLDSY